MIRVSLSTNWAVRAQARVYVWAGADEAWRVMRRFGRFIAADPYHTRATDADGRPLDTVPRRGTPIRIGHGVGVTLFERAGTLIRSHPGRGFAFTDLSKRGRNAGFPHVYAYRLEPINDGLCELTLTVRGRWSARWVPRDLVLCWLWWVLFQARWLMHTHLAHEIDRQRARSAQQPGAS